VNCFRGKSFTYPQMDAVLLVCGYLYFYLLQVSAWLGVHEFVLKSNILLAHTYTHTHTIISRRFLD